MTRKQRVSRVVYATFVVGVGAFTVSNVWQVAGTVFGDHSGADYPKVEGACGATIEREIAAIERARIASSGAADADSARAHYAESKKADAVDVKAACANDPNGVDAIAAVQRLDREAESHAVRDATEIAPVRQGARSFIKVQK